MNRPTKYVLMHGTFYEVRDDELMHGKWKYIKREKVNGKWRYIYDLGKKEKSAKNEALNRVNKTAGDLAKSQKAYQDIKNKVESGEYNTTGKNAYASVEPYKKEYDKAMKEHDSAVKNAQKAVDKYQETPMGKAEKVTQKITKAAVSAKKKIGEKLVKDVDQEKVKKIVSNTASITAGALRVAALFVPGAGAVLNGVATAATFVNTLANVKR